MIPIVAKIGFRRRHVQLNVFEIQNNFNIFMFLLLYLDIQRQVEVSKSSMNGN